MIVIRVEHHGLTGIVTEIARAKIISASTSPSRETATYVAATYKGRCAAELDRYRQSNSTIVQNHERKTHIWHLIAKALKGMGYGD